MAQPPYREDEKAYEESEILKNVYETQD